MCSNENLTGSSYVYFIWYIYLAFNNVSHWILNSYGWLVCDNIGMLWISVFVIIFLSLTHFELWAIIDRHIGFSFIHSFLSCWRKGTHRHFFSLFLFFIIVVNHSELENIGNIISPILNYHFFICKLIGFDLLSLF